MANKVIFHIYPYLYLLIRVVQVIRNQGGGSPPVLTIFENWGGGGGEFFFENYKFYMAYFGLIKLESSNLLDIIIIDGYYKYTY